MRTIQTRGVPSPVLLGLLSLFGTFCLFGLFGSPALHAQDSALPLLTLEEALELAREHNPQILRARNSARIAANNVTRGNAGYLPSLNLSAQQNRRTMGSGMGGAGLFEEATLDVVTTLGFTAFDARRSAIFDVLEVEDEEFRIASEQTEEGVLAEVAVVYYDLVRQQQQLETLREAIEISEDRMRIAELRLDLGSASELDVRLAQVDRNADQAAFLRQEVALATGLADLNRLLSHELPPEYRVSEVIPVNRTLDLDDLSRTALEANRGIRLAEQGVVAESLERDVIRRERWPTVGVQVGYALNDLADPVGLEPSRPSGITYGVSVGVPLFDGFNRARRIENARIRVESSRLLLEEAQTRVLTGMESAYASYRNRIALVELEEENAELARQNAELALERFSLGLSSSLELREAQNALTSARSRLASAQFDAKQAEIDLLLLGGRFRELAP